MNEGASMSNNMSNKGTSPAGGPGPDNRVLTPVVDVSGLRDVPVVVVPAAGVSWLPLPVGPVPVGPRYAPSFDIGFSPNPCPRKLGRLSGSSTRPSLSCHLCAPGRPIWSRWRGRSAAWSSRPVCRWPTRAPSWGCNNSGRDGSTSARLRVSVCCRHVPGSTEGGRPAGVSPCTPVGRFGSQPTSR